MANANTHTRASQARGCANLLPVIEHDRLRREANTDAKRRGPAPRAGHKPVPAHEELGNAAMSDTARNDE